MPASALRREDPPDRIGVEGIRAQMTRGLGLEDAIRAHAAMWRAIFDNAADMSVSEGRRGENFRSMAVSLACDAFYPESRA